MVGETDVNHYPVFSWFCLHIATGYFQACFSRYCKEILKKEGFEGCFFLLYFCLSSFSFLFLFSFLFERDWINRSTFLFEQKKTVNWIFSSPILASFTTAFNGLSARIRIEEINYKKNIKPCVPKTSVLLTIQVHRFELIYHIITTTTIIIIILRHYNLSYDKNTI